MATWQAYGKASDSAASVPLVRVEAKTRAEAVQKCRDKIVNYDQYYAAWNRAGKRVVRKGNASR